MRVATRCSQNADAAAGIVRDELKLRKAANAKAEVPCAKCGTVFKVTKKNADARIHCESKHPKDTFAEYVLCSPCRREPKHRSLSVCPPPPPFTSTSPSEL
jgi:hypothetical protein